MLCFFYPNIYFVCVYKYVSWRNYNFIKMCFFSPVFLVCILFQCSSKKYFVFIFIFCWLGYFFAEIERFKSFAKPSVLTSKDKRGRYLKWVRYGVCAIVKKHCQKTLESCCERDFKFTTLWVFLFFFLWQNWIFFFNNLKTNK